MAGVLFLQDNGINESLALCDVAGALRHAGHHCRLLLEDEERDLDAAIRAFSPAVVVIPCPVAGATTTAALARRARAVLPGATIALAGTQATLDPASVARWPGVDVVVVGEAEEALTELVDRVAADRGWEDVPNLAWAAPEGLRQNALRPPAALDALPMPDRGIYHRYPFIQRFPWKKFATGRGCVHRCNFCWNTSLRRMYGTEAFVRRKSPERVIAEILAVTASAPLRHVHFSDDLFTVHPSWIEAFAGLYRARVGLPFTCNTSVELISPRTVGALASAGCRGVAFGLETASEPLRVKILNKTFSNHEVRAAAALIKGAGMELTTFNMLASPGETLEDGLATVALNRAIGADHVRVNLAVPLPYTPFEVAAREAGVVAGPDPATLHHPRPVFAPELATEFLNLYHLFRPAVHHAWLGPLLPRLIRLPTPRLLEALRVLIPVEERRIYRLGWVDGLRYYRHVGDPHRRTANYVSLP